MALPPCQHGHRSERLIFPDWSNCALPFPDRRTGIRRRVSCGGCLVSTASHDLHVSSGNGRCSAFASSRGARIQTSRSSSVVRITGIAFGWIGSTIALDDAVKKPSTRCGRTSGLRLRTPRSSLRASARRAEPLYQSRFMRSVLEKALRSFVTEAAAGGHSTPRPVRQFLFVVPAQGNGAH